MAIEGAGGPPKRPRLDPEVRIASGNGNLRPTFGGDRQGEPPPGVHGFPMGQLGIPPPGLGAVVRPQTDVSGKGGNTQQLARDGKTPLYRAVESGDLVRCKASRKESNVNAKNASGFTPLHSAVLEKDILSVLDLCHAGASPAEEDSFGLRPIDYAVINRDGDIAFCLRAFGGDSVMGPNSLGLTALDMCKALHGKQGARWSSQFLMTDSTKVESDPSVNLDQERGNMSLHDAVLDDKINVVLDLLGKGENPNRANALGLRPLDLAALLDRPKAAEFLIMDAVADVLGPGPWGMTPLEIAQKMGHAAVVNVISKWAEINQQLSALAAEGAHPSHG
jgi:ankyrin repeat protein